MKNKEIGYLTNFSSESGIYKEFADWSISDCKELLDILNAKIYDQPELKTLVTAIWCYIRQICAFQEPSSNVLIKGPARSGKTSIYKIVKNYFRNVLPNLPVLKINAYELSMVFDGEGDLGDLLAPLSYCESTEPAGIIFIDEADLCLDAYGSKLSTTIVLQKIISLITERSIFVNNNEFIRTDNVMFIYMGEFDDEDYDSNRTRELLNNFTFEMELHAINEDSIRKIINDKISEMSALTGMEVKISETYMQKIVSEIKKDHDWKGVFRKLEAGVMKIYTEHLFAETMSPKYTISITFDEEPTFAISQK